MEEKEAKKVNMWEIAAIVLFVLLIVSVAIIISIGVSNSDRSAAPAVENNQDVLQTESGVACNNECEAPTCDSIEYYDCVADENGCMKKVHKGKILNKCGIECFSVVNCQDNEVCHKYKCVEIEDGTQTVEELFLQKKEMLEQQKLIDEKLQTCSQLCAGSSVGIPSVKDECDKKCYDEYYYKGEDGLDSYISSMIG